MFTSNILHLVIRSPNSWEIFDISGFIDSIKCINQYPTNFVICKNITVDINYCSPFIESYYFIDCRICSLNVTQQDGYKTHLNFYRCLFMCDFDAEIKTSSIYMDEIKSFVYSMYINIDYPTFSYFLCPDELGKSDDDTSYQESYKIIVSGDGIINLDIRNVEYDYHDFIIKNESNLSINLLNTRKITLDNGGTISGLNITDSEQLVLNLTNKIGRIIIEDTSIEELKFKNCNFISKVPVFDNSSTIKHSVDIDKKSFDNLLKVKQIGSLEFSRLAEFFNRNNAYIEAQQLHRHYLLAKAKESKSKGLKTWVWLYDFISGCGTSLAKPVIWILLLFIFNLFIILLGSDLLGFDITYYAVNTTIPIFKLASNHIELSNGILLVLNISSILATLLWFLIALQIRKLLRLKE